MRLLAASDIQALNNISVVIELLCADSRPSDHRLCSDTTRWFGKSPVLGDRLHRAGHPHFEHPFLVFAHVFGKLTNGWNHSVFLVILARLRCLSTKMSDQSFKQPLVRMTVQRAILSVGSAKPRKRVPSSVYCQTNVPGYVFSLPHRRPSVQPAAMYQGLHDVGLA